MGKSDLSLLNKNVRFTPDKLRYLFDYVRNRTNDFRDFDSSLLCEKPESIRIFRLLLGKNTSSFGAIFNRAGCTISSIEMGMIRFSMNGALRYMVPIKEIFIKFEREKLTYEKLRENYDRFYTHKHFSLMRQKAPRESSVLGGIRGGNTTRDRYGIDHYKKIAKIGAMKGGVAVAKKYSHEHFQMIGKMTGEVHGKKKLGDWGRIGGLVTASKQELTNQEKEIGEILDKNNILYEPHKDIAGFDRDYIVDFFIELNKSKIIIEATKMRDKTNIYSYAKSLELAERIKLIRLKNKNVKSICIVSPKFSVEGIVKLSQEYDCVLLDKNLNELPFVIHNIDKQYSLGLITKREIKHVVDRKVMFRKAALVTKDLNLHKSEIKIINSLNKKRIEFSSQQVLESNFGSIRIVDFIVDPYNTILEVSSIEGKSNKTLSRTINRLETRFLLLKEFYSPDYNFVGIIDNVKQDEIDRFNPKFKLLSMDKFLSNPRPFI